MGSQILHCNVKGLPHGGQGESAVNPLLLAHFQKLQGRVSWYHLKNQLTKRKKFWERPSCLFTELRLHWHYWCICRNFTLWAWIGGLWLYPQMPVRSKPRLFPEEVTSFPQILFFSLYWIQGLVHVDLAPVSNFLRTMSGSQ